jgi:uncharacterized protein YjbI with pentapeptide repeats
MKAPRRPSFFRPAATSLSWLALLGAALLLGPTRAATSFEPRPVTLTLSTSASGLTLSWTSVTVLTNSGVTPLLPAHRVEVSLDLTNWWATLLVIPQRVGLPFQVIQTNLPLVPPDPLFLRVVSFVNLTNADFAGVDWHGLDLSGLDLSGSDFSRANLAGANLTSAKLARSHLSAAILDDTLLDHADLTAVTAEGALFRRTHAQYLALPQATLHQADFRLVDFSDADLYFSDFSFADFRGAEWDDTSEVGCDFYGAIFFGNP